MAYSEDELAGLSETERAALTATDEQDDETLNDIAGDGDGDEGEGDEGNEEGDDSSDDAGDDKADDKAAGDDKGADDIAVPDADLKVSLDDFDLDDVPTVLFVPNLSSELSAEAEAAIEALETKLDDGEISQAEYRKEVRAIETESRNEDIRKQLWAAEQAAFFKANPDYSAGKNPELFAQLNKEVMRIARDPNNTLTGIQTICLAKHNLAEAIEFAEFKAAKAAQKNDGKPVDGKKTVPAKPSAKRPDLQTLRDTPSADTTDTGQDKFAHLDKLSGMALEAAISRMSQAEQDAYLAGA